MSKKYSKGSHKRHKKKSGAGKNLHTATGDSKSNSQPKIIPPQKDASFDTRINEGNQSANSSDHTSFSLKTAETGGVSTSYGVLIVTFSLFLLLLLSWLSDVTFTPFPEAKLHFKALSELFIFRQAGTSAKAKRLISGYENDGSKKSSEHNQSTAPVSASPLLINNSHNGISALENYFNALKNEAPNRLIRIAHYGDSQLEGDRISSQLREGLQKLYGGNGYGFAPLADIANSVSYERTNSENLLKYNVFSMHLKPGENYGLSGTAYKFAYQVVQQNPDKADSLNSSEPADNDTSITTATQKPTTKFFTSGSVVYRFKSDRSFNSAYLLFGKVAGATLLTIRGDKGEQIYSGNLFANEEYKTNTLNRLILPADKMQKSLSITLSGDNRTLFYGLYLDNDKNLQVDNYSIRGHSGNGLLQIRDDFAAEQLKYLNTRLVMLQFGGNTVPYIYSESQKKFLKDLYTSVVAKIKKLYPAASVLIVGVGDMAKSYNGEYRTYDGLSIVQSTLKEIAVENNCAFIDLYELMGGENSILEWANKGLAAKDGHFGPGGQKIIANEIIKLLDEEYKLYLRHKGQQ